MESTAALEILAQDAGDHFDPKIVDTFVAAFADSSSGLAAVRHRAGSHDLPTVDDEAAVAAQRSTAAGGPSLLAQLR